MSKRAIIPIIVLLVDGLLFVAINGRWTLWLSDRAWRETDDGYVGRVEHPDTVRKIEVEDYQSVRPAKSRQFEQNEPLASVPAEAAVKMSSAKASLLEAHLGLSKAQGGLKRAMGEIPR